MWDYSPPYFLGSLMILSDLAGGDFREVNYFIITPPPIKTLINNSLNLISNNYD